MTPATARDYLVHQLKGRIYSDLYTRGGAPSTIWGNDGDVGDNPEVFASKLSAANTGVGSWEGGWCAVEATPTGVSVRKNGLLLWVRPDDCLFPDVHEKAGTAVCLRLPKELFSMSPGYYLALSDENDEAAALDTIVRIYWNLTAIGAAAFLTEATRLLNAAGLFFRAKVLNDPRAYGRCDAGVIYLHKHQYPAAANILAHTYRSVAVHMRPLTPLFTKVLAPGLALAEDPGGAESFGQHRSHLLAEGVVRAHELKARNEEAQFRVLCECYSKAGISLRHPYLNPGSEDIYAFAAG